MTKGDTFTIISISPDKDQKAALTKAFKDFVFNFKIVDIEESEKSISELIGQIKKERPIAIFYDITPEKDNHYTLINSISEEIPSCSIVIVHNTNELIAQVELMKYGAYDYLVKPYSINAIKKVIDKILEIQQEKSEKYNLQSAFLEHAQFSAIISHSPEMEKVLSMAARSAMSNATILIRGESGTGKELIARAIHVLSPRKNMPFITVNIAALSENLIESELFGHIKGSFTGALQDRLGRFEQAKGGTLFIDEIGDIPMGIQIKLLRALQFGTFEKVGDNSTKEVNVRIIAATNKNLEEAIKEGRFRADLFYRINVIPIFIPALQDHKRDIPYLTKYFIQKHAKKNQKIIEGITDNAMNLLLSKSFPGNVRELENIIERAVVLTRNPLIEEYDLFVPGEEIITELSEVDANEVGIADSYENSMIHFETRLLMQTLDKAEGNKSKAARMLGISERRLRLRLIKIQEHNKEMI